jgi:hypothetical protein
VFQHLDYLVNEHFVLVIGINVDKVLRYLLEIHDILEVSKIDINTNPYMVPEG